MARYQGINDIIMQKGKINKSVLLTNAGTTVAQNVIDYSFTNISRIYAVDIDPFCYAAKILKNNFFVVPPLSNWISYQEALLKICRQKNIDLIIPCSNDEELLKFSVHRGIFEKKGINILLSNSESIKLCADKYKCNNFVSTLGIKVPETYLPREIPAKVKLPLILKNRKGEGSTRLEIINNRRDLFYFKSKYKNIIFQKLVKGVEYSIDLVADKNSNLVMSSCRKRLAVKAGICIKTEIINNHQLIDWSARIVKNMKLIGPINIQFIGDYFIEVNPRLPGGLGLVSAAGFNMSLLAIKSFFTLPITKKEQRVRKVKVLRVWKDYVYE